MAPAVVSAAISVAPGYQLLPKQPLTARGLGHVLAAGNSAYFLSSQANYGGEVNIYRYEVGDTVPSLFASGANAEAQEGPGRLSFRGGTRLAWDASTQVLYLLADEFPGGRILRLEDKNGNGIIDFEQSTPELVEWSVAFDFADSAQADTIPTAFALAPGGGLYVSLGPPFFVWPPETDLYLLQDVDSDGQFETILPAAVGDNPNTYTDADTLLVDAGDPSVLYLGTVDDNCFCVGTLKRYQDGDGDGLFLGENDSVEVLAQGGLLQNVNGLAQDVPGRLWVGVRDVGGVSRLLRYTDTDADGFPDTGQTVLESTTDDFGLVTMDFALPGMELRAGEDSGQRLLMQVNDPSFTGVSALAVLRGAEPVQEQHLDLLPGWNSLGLTVQPDAGATFRSLVLDQELPLDLGLTMYRNRWLVGDVARSSADFPLYMSTGMLARSTSVGEVTLSGGLVSHVPLLRLERGWNAVSLPLARPDLGIAELTKTANAAAGAAVVTAAADYTRPGFTLYLPGGPLPSFTVQPGRAYFIYSSEPVEFRPW